MTSNTDWIAEHVVVAPMVRGSERAFRELLRRHYPHCLLYSPMLVDRNIVNKNHTETQHLLHELKDNVIVQICGSDPTTLQQACREVLRQAPHIKGVCFNLGCPQSCARDGHFGAFVSNDQAVVCVQALRSILVTKELRAKIRLRGDTVQFALTLQAAGVDVLAVHGRERDAKFQGNVDLNRVQQVIDALDIPVILNGAAITCLSDAQTIVETTGCAHVMMARSFLRNPHVLLDQPSSPTERLLEYMEFAQKYPVPDYRYYQLHFKWMLRSALNPPNKDTAKFDPTNWRHRFWNFLQRPYLTHYQQWVDIIRLYAHLSNEPLPGPLPTFATIRNYGKAVANKKPRLDKEVVKTTID